MLPLPHSPKIIEKKGNRAIFEIEALYPGYGTTIANVFRRVLLSSLPGAAVTKMKIKGVQHEFSTIPGVLEDVITIMLNLKQLRFKVFNQETQKATLKVKGENIIKGSDFKIPTQVELINKDCHIATLTDKKADLEMEIQIERGLGYEPVERRKKEKLEIGTVAIDAIFTPVRKVSYQIENMRVGERTDFDKLKLEIETDGTLAPEDAFFRASEIIINHFSLFSEAFAKEIAKAAAKKEETIAIAEDLTKFKLEDLKLSTRTANALLQSNIKTLGGLLRKSEDSLLQFEGMGQKGIKEIKKALKKLGLEIKSEKE